MSFFGLVQKSEKTDGIVICQQLQRSPIQAWDGIINEL